MPSIADAIKAAAALNNAPSASPNPVGAPSDNVDFQPGRNNMLRCPMPTLWQDSPDSYRQFYLKGQVPQQRIMTPLPVAPGSSSSSSSTVVAGSSSGSSSSGGSSSGSGSGSSGGASTVSQASITTPVLSSGAQFSGALTVSKTFQLLAITTNSPCRVEFYGTALAQVQDQGRAMDFPPPAGSTQNLITDVVLDTAPYLWFFQNRVGGNADSPQKDVVYVTLTNIGANTTAITLSLQYIALESL